MCPATGSIPAIGSQGSSEVWTLKENFKTELLRDEREREVRGHQRDPTRVPVPCHAPILPVFQFQKFPAKAAKPGQTGLSKAFEFVFKGQDRISTLTRAAGDTALEESERESRSSPQEAGEGRAPSPSALEADPQARRPGGRGRASTRTNSPRSRARSLSAEVGLGATPLRNVEVLLLRWRTFPPRGTSYAEGSLSSFDDRPRWDALTVGLDVDHERRHLWDFCARERDKGEKGRRR